MKLRKLRKKTTVVSAGGKQEDLPVPPGIIPHFLLKRKKKQTSK